MRRLVSILILSSFGCGVAPEAVGVSRDALTCRTCGGGGDPGSGPPVVGGGDGGGGGGGGGAPVTPVGDLPQGLTCGLSYYSSAFGHLFTNADAHACNGVLTVVDYAGYPVTAAAPGYYVVDDGDMGMPTGAGFYHQELGGAPATTDLARSTRFVLPAGTACGFHHTRVSPGHTCMGIDPATGQCPSGWIAKAHFDMSSDWGHWVWCEYQDPNHFCADDGCLQHAVWGTGVACGISSNTDGAGAGQCAGRPTNIGCPSVTARSPYYDDGRPDGQGVAFCHM